MRYIGLSDGTTNWIESYLTNCFTFVEIGGYMSSEKEIKCWVPQGSILGSLLFLIYMNDMSQSVNCNLLLYADDSCSIVTHKDINYIENTLMPIYPFMWLVSQ